MQERYISGVVREQVIILVSLVNLYSTETHFAMLIQNQEEKVMTIILSSNHQREIMVTLIVKHILPTSTIRNVSIPVRSICMLTPGLEKSSWIMCAKDIHGQVIIDTLDQHSIVSIIS